MATCKQATEVYSRVVGYHRPVKNWNKGKQAEFTDRTEYSLPTNGTLAAVTAAGVCGSASKACGAA